MTREEFEILDSWVYTKIKMNRDYYSRAKIIEMIMERVEELVNKTNDIHNVMHCEVCNDTHDVRVICKDCINDDCNDRV